MLKQLNPVIKVLNSYSLSRRTALLIATLIFASAIPLVFIGALQSMKSLEQKRAHALQPLRVPKVSSACQYKKVCTTTNGQQECDSFVLSCTNTTISSENPDTSNNPVGFLETVDCQKATGWAYNAAIPSKYIQVILYADGEIGTGTYLEAIPANLRLDSNDVVEVLGNHEFLAPLPNSLKDGNLHQIYAYAYDASASATPALLLGSPRAIACAQAVFPIKTPLDTPGKSNIPTETK